VLVIFSSSILRQAKLCLHVASKRACILLLHVHTYIYMQSSCSGPGSGRSVTSTCTVAGRSVTSYQRMLAGICSSRNSRLGV
jgi:hypothetical protein